MTHAQWIAYVAKQAHRLKPEGNGHLPDPGPESHLQKRIFTHCEEKRCLCFSGSMAHKTKRRRGEMDMEIYLPGGRLLLIEAKSATGKLSQAQLENRAWLGILGHTVHVVDSFEQFLGIFNAAMKTGAGTSINGASCHCV